MSALVGAGSFATVPVRAQQDLADEDPSVPMQHGSLLTLWSGRALTAGGYALSLGVDARSLDSPEGAGAERELGRGSASRFALLGSLGLWRGVDVSAGVAVGRLSFEPDAQNPADEPALDESVAAGQDTWFDLRLVPRFQLWGDASGNALAVLVPLWLPRGAPSAHAEPGLRLGPRLAVNVGTGLLGVTLNAGYVAHPSESSLATAARDFARLGAGVELRLEESLSILSELGGRWWPRAGASDNDRRFSSEARLGGRYLSGGWALQVGVGRGVTGDRTEPAWRMLANVSVSSDAFDEPVAVASPAATEPLAPPAETTRYPNETSDWQASVAAPEAPTVVAPGPAAPTTALSAPPAQASSAELPPLPVIDTVLHYARYQYRLSPRQIQQLKKVARQLRAAGPGVHIIVEGHTDDTGPKASNRKLSRQRASSVRHQLMRWGIPGRRITITAHGASRPVPGASRPGAHRRNRRVELRLMRVSPDEGVEVTKKKPPPRRSRPAPP